VPIHAHGSLLAGRYRIVEPLGSGGMATVFLCEDERLGRRVAVKRLHAHSPDEMARRFAREAKLGASLNHPNLVAVYDTVTDDEGVLIVMEHVHGDTLARLLRDGPLERGAALAVVRDVAAALDHAHGHGVVHRDVKPANVLIRDDGTAKLVDLGIATAADQTRITRSGIVLGTAAYMAPEQLDGREAGPAADVYALAVVAYEALAGERARQGTTPLEIAHKVTTEPPPDVREADPSLPPAVGEALARGMARDPADRHRSAGELAHELKDALGGEEPTAVTRRVDRTPVPAAAAAAPDRRPPEDRPSAVLPDGRPAPIQRSRRRVPWGAVALVAAFLAIGFAAAFGALSGGGDDEGGSGGEERAQNQPAERDRDRPAREREREQPQSAAPTESEAAPAEPEAAPAPAPESEPEADPQPASGGTSGAELNDQGFALMQQGRYDEAVPILQRAVDSFPEGTTDLNYAYALFNLGAALRRAGRPEEAIPVLERRLQIPNQTGTVRRELEAARREAGSG
jgi:eukaryotic-like serine/threonine-protein kinase